MSLIADLDRPAVARVCRTRRVRRLSMFGSGATGKYRHGRSDVDFLVEFEPDQTDPFDAYFGLKEDLELLVQAPVDLVVDSVLTNPFFASRVRAEAVEIYAP